MSDIARPPPKKRVVRPEALVSEPIATELVGSTRGAPTDFILSPTVFPAVADADPSTPPRTWVCIGSLTNALEGAARVRAPGATDATLAAASNYLSGTQTEEVPGGTVLVVKADMHLPCISGTWRASRLFPERTSPIEGTEVIANDVESDPPCGAVFYNTELVGSDAHMAQLLVRDGLSLMENSDYPQHGIYNVGRYSWDFIRDLPDADKAAYGLTDEGVFEILQNELFEGRTCFFVDANVLADDLFPKFNEMAQSSDESAVSHYMSAFQRGEEVVGAVSCLPDQEYQFARVFVHRDGEGRSVGVKAVMYFTYNSPESMHEMFIETTPFPPKEGKDEDETEDDPDYIFEDSS